MKHENKVLLINVLKKPIVSTILAIIFGFLVSGAIIGILGYSPPEALSSLFTGIFSRPKYIFKVIEKSTPIIFTGISIVFAFKAGLFNIGAEGQYIIGAIASTVVGILFNFHPIIQIPLVIFSGVLASSILGALNGLLKAKFGVHEVISGIMFNWICLYLCNFIVNSPLFHKASTSKTYSINKSGFITLFHEWKKSKEGIEFLRNNSFLSDVFLKTDLNVSFLVAILIAITTWFILYKTTLGFGIRAVGHSTKASELAGIDVKINIVKSMGISGAICGLAAALNIAGVSPHALYLLNMFENVGFNGISVALIGASSPIGCIFSGLFFGGLIYGGNNVQSDLGIPSEIINITIGAILFSIALTKIIPSIVKKFIFKIKESDDI